MFVVPNHLVEQWGAEFLKLYPQAHIFVAGKEHFATGNRQQAMARIATGNYDAVIVSHRSFEFLPVSDETVQPLRRASRLRSSKTPIREAKAEKGDNRRIVKELEKAKKRLDAKLKERADRESKDNTLTFEELGIDQIFVDEADLYKNLGSTPRKMNRIAGLPNSESNRALDMYMKTRYLARATAARRRLCHRHADLQHHGRDVHDAALSRAGDAQGRAASSISTPGRPTSARRSRRSNSRRTAPATGCTRALRNSSTCRSCSRCSARFADVQTADMLNLPRPEIEGGKPQIVAAPASPELKEFVGTLVERAQKTAQRRRRSRASTTC